MPHGSCRPASDHRCQAEWKHFCTATQMHGLVSGRSRCWRSIDPWLHKRPCCASDDRAPYVPRLTGSCWQWVLQTLQPSMPAAKSPSRPPAGSTARRCSARWRAAGAASGASRCAAAAGARRRAARAWPRSRAADAVSIIFRSRWPGGSHMVSPVHSNQRTPRVRCARGLQAHVEAELPL